MGAAMSPTMLLAAHHGALAWTIGLALSLVLAAFLTPARWWRRPTARGLAILGGGTWAIGTLLLLTVPDSAWTSASPSASPSASTSAFTPASTPGSGPAITAVAHAGVLQADVPAQHIVPAAGQRYRVHRDLNVRGSAGVGADRLAVVPAGALVTPTGERQGDWWRIRYDGGGGERLGWASSLWLRRSAER